MNPIKKYLLLLALLCLNLPLLAQKPDLAKNRKGESMNFEGVCAAPECEVDAGEDQIICLGEETILEGTVECGGDFNYQYCWLNTKTLEEECSYSSLSFEVFDIEEDTRYRLQVKLDDEIVKEDEVIVSILNTESELSGDRIRLKEVPPEPGGVVEFQLMNPSIQGMVYPENYNNLLELTVELCLSNEGWRPVLTKVISPYSITYRLNPLFTEVTGIEGNTTAENHCDQVSDLLSPPRDDGATTAVQWYMLNAVKAHEEAHLTRFEPALIETVRIFEDEIFRSESYYINDIGQSYEEAKSEWYNIHYINLVLEFHTTWLDRINIAVMDDHQPGNVTQQAEEEIKLPIVGEICCHAKTTREPNSGFTPWAECQKCSDTRIPSCD